MRLGLGLGFAKGGGPVAPSGPAVLTIAAMVITPVYGDVGLYKGRTLTIGAMTITPTYGNVALTAARKLAVSSITITPSYGDVTLTATRKLSIAAMTVTPTYGDVTLTWSGESSGITGLDSEIMAIAAKNYVSGHKWLNEVTSPNDGSSQTDHDLWLGTGDGADTADPTKVGSGNGAYFNCNTDYFTGVNTVDFLNKITRTTGGTPWWIAVIYERNSYTTCPWDAGNGANALRLQVDSQNKLYMANKASFNAGPIAQGTPAGIIVSGPAFVTPGTPDIRLWVNNGTKASAAGGINNVSVNTAGTANPIRLMNNQAASIGTTNHKIWGFAYGNEHLDDAEAATLYDWMETISNETLI